MSGSLSSGRSETGFFPRCSSMTCWGASLVSNKYRKAENDQVIEPTDYMHLVVRGKVPGGQTVGNGQRHQGPQDDVDPPVEGQSPDQPHESDNRREHPRPQHEQQRHRQSEPHDSNSDPLTFNSNYRPRHGRWKAECSTATSSGRMGPGSGAGAATRPAHRIYCTHENRPRRTGIHTGVLLGYTTTRLGGPSE